VTLTIAVGQLQMFTRTERYTLTIPKRTAALSRRSNISRKRSDFPESRANHRVNEGAHMSESEAQDTFIKPFEERTSDGRPETGAEAECMIQAPGIRKSWT
jgi:hypothetical protein